MSVPALLLPLLILLPAPAELPRSSIATKEFDKFSKDVTAYFAALDPGRDDRKAQAESLAKIKDAYDKLAKRAKVDEPLKYVGDWDQILERGKAEDRELRQAAGKGFVRYVADWDGVRVACMVSVPAAYGKGDTLCPAILALKPTLGMSGDVLEKEVAAQATKAYAGLLDSTIVVVPLGPEKTVDRKGQSHEIEGSWMTDEGMTSLFYGVRVLLYGLHFDRSRLVLDGWKDSGLDAIMVASSFPSWFAGIVNRSGAIGGDEVLYQNLGGTPLLYVDGGADARGADMEALKKRCENITEVTVIADAQSALDPTEEGRTKLSDWISARHRDLAPAKVDYMLGDRRFQSVAWLKAATINLRATAKPGDKDFPHITAEIDQATNTIRLTTVNVTELYVYLNDALLDLSKPVNVEVNGLKWPPRTVRRDLRYMFENRYFNSSGDYGVYTAELHLEDIPANVPKGESPPAGENPPAGGGGGARP
jgi:hypothetical protein